MDLKRGVLTLLPALLAYRPGAVNSLCQELNAECTADKFPCFRDCCGKGEWFCNTKREVCEKCSTRRTLCGNETMPVECLIYCEKIRRASLTDDSGDVKQCVPWYIPIAEGGSMALVIVGLLVLVLYLCRQKRVLSRGGSVPKEPDDISLNKIGQPQQHHSSGTGPKEAEPLLPDGKEETDPTNLNLSLQRDPDTQKAKAPEAETDHPQNSPGSDAQRETPPAPSSTGRADAGPTNMQPSDTADPQEASPHVRPASFYGNDVQGPLGLPPAGGSPTGRQGRLNGPNNVIPTGEDPAGGGGPKAIAFSSQDPSKGYRKA